MVGIDMLHTRDARRLGALAGVVAAAVALGFGELIAALDPDAPGPVAAVGNVVIDWSPGWFERAAIDAVGTNDKPLLLAGIVVACLVFGGAIGRRGAERPAFAACVFGVFAVIGAGAGIDDPLANDLLAVVAPLCGAAAGVGALFVVGRPLRAASAHRPDLYRPGASTLERADVHEPDVARSPAPAQDPRLPTATRRAFFTYATAAGAFAVTSASGATLLRAGPSEAEKARGRVKLRVTDPTGPTGATVPSGTRVAMRTDFDRSVGGITPYVTDVDDFYLIDTALVKPRVDPANWSLRFEGLCDAPFTLTYDEILGMDLVEETITIACVSNEVGGDLIGNATWIGVPLLDLVERAQPRADASQVMGVSVDEFTAGFPTELLRDGRKALLAVGMNGEPLTIRHGFPARLVVAGIYGYVSAVKWISKVRFVPWEGVDGYWMPRGWAKEGPVKTQCRIDVPTRGMDLRPGPVSIAGVAWAPTRGIQRVEVQVDDGEWAEAELDEVLNDDTWRQWRLVWTATPGTHRIRARATDGTGTTQTAESAEPAPDGATGYPTRTIEVAD